MRFRHTWKSPVGELRLFHENDTLTGLYFEGHTPAPKSDAGTVDAAPFRLAIEQLSEYFESERDQFDLPISFDGTEFQMAVWKQLQGIPFGETIRYGTIADSLNRPNAMRAVGAAVGRNPISIIIPCHRVLGANGKLTGFAGGLDRKKKLLELEQAQVALP